MFFQDFAYKLSKDSRLLHTNLFQSFLYTRVAMVDIYRSMLTDAQTLASKKQSKHNHGCHSAVATKEKQETDDEDEERNHLELVLDNLRTSGGTTDSNVVIPDVTQEYEFGHIVENMKSKIIVTIIMGRIVVVLTVTLISYFKAFTGQSNNHKMQEDTTV